MLINSDAIGAQSGEIGHPYRQVAGRITLGSYEHRVPPRVGPVAGSGECTSMESLTMSGYL